jgi:hypothetical protein
MRDSYSRRRGPQVRRRLAGGTAEIAQRLGLTLYQRVHELRSRDPDFPEPVVRLRQALLWYRPEVEWRVQATGRA